LKSLEWTPDERFPSAGEFRKAVEEAAAPVSAVRKGSVDTISPEISRPPSSDSEISPKPTSHHKAGEKSPPSGEQRKSGKPWLYLLLTVLVLTGAGYACWRFFQGPAEKYRLTVSPDPPDASVRIIHPEMEYLPEMEVEPGLYHITVALKGYVTQEKRIKVGRRDVDIRVKLHTTTITNPLGMKFVYISPGSFIMGSRERELSRDKDEQPHQVTLAEGYYMQTTEVTNAQFVVFLNDVGRRGTESRPWFGGHRWMKSKLPRESGPLKKGSPRPWIFPWPIPGNGFACWLSAGMKAGRKSMGRMQAR